MYFAGKYRASGSAMAGSYGVSSSRSLLFRAPMGGANDQRLEKVHGETRGVRFDHDGFAKVAGHGWTKFKDPNPPVHLPYL
ncbi:hypothetical protein IscW_ISCW021744 [Ixodes scapularis]|uniref:Uncharacterized protein n=1 Tax=Ixodes scapularis TaxID=6945 RepID=B7Q7W0_IXOSC|nr:hypothetical protein IscW_ISCW021744 [Ixodes scapularis]|eukprot:XP_002412225.1 hypothetical protein IscW_ISCW021744 [Ixodes scapularis]